MIIQSDYLTEGLFGQVFTWMLEVLPYVESQGWRPAWCIRTKNYGAPPDFNLFPGVVHTPYSPEADDRAVSFERLQHRRKFNFRHDFRAAHRHWDAHFRFSDDVYARLDEFWQADLSGETVLGLHYRGTDKNADPWQTNPVSMHQFLCVVEDFLKCRPDVTAIFAATDDARFLQALQGFPRVHFYRQA